MDAFRNKFVRKIRSIGAWQFTAFAIALFALTLWITNLAHYYPFFADDGFISLRYAQRLLEGKGLTWTDGETVEGYSNLAYVLLTAFFGIAFDLVDSARIVGILGVLALILAIFRAGRPFSPTAKMAVPLIYLVLASTSSLAIWAIGGLEATLLLGLVVLAYVEFGQSPKGDGSMKWLGSGCLALACWTRPDAPIFVAWLAGWELLRGKLSKNAWKRSVLASSLPILAWISQTAFRLIYYQDWIPNTARVKAEFSMHRLGNGLEYVGSAFDGAWWLVGLAGLALYAAWHDGHRREQILLTVGAGTIWLGYVILIGGDIFPGSRHALPAYGLFALSGLWGIEWLLLSVSSPQSRASEAKISSPSASGRGGVVVISITAAASLFVAQRHDQNNRYAEIERWEWSAEPVGKLYQRFLAMDPLMAVEPAGALPYFSRLRSLDMYGLCDRHIASTPSRPGLHLAHDHGDSAYLWQREPDLMVLRMPWGGTPGSLSGMELFQREDFRDHYLAVNFLAIDPFDVQAQAQVRIKGKLGIQQSEHEVIVPGYMFQGSQILGHASSSGQVGALVGDASGGYSPVFRLGPGQWQLEVQSVSPWIRISLRNRSTHQATVLVQNQKVTLETVTEFDMRVASPERVHSEFGAIKWVRNIEEDAFTRPHRVYANQELVVIEPSLSAPLEPKNWHWLPLDKQKNGFVQVDNNRRLAKGKINPRCKSSAVRSDWPSDSIRSNSFHRRKGDNWIGEAKGPTFIVPRDGLVYSCVSGSQNSAGLRLRLTDTQEIVRAWFGKNSPDPVVSTNDISPFAGRPARFEVYDQATGAWGHIQVHALGIASTKSVLP